LSAPTGSSSVTYQLRDDEALSSDTTTMFITRCELADSQNCSYYLWRKL